MSRILRRPMFRGGRVSSYGTGIAHGLADGGAIGGGNIVGTKMADGRYGFQDPRWLDWWKRIGTGSGSGTGNVTTGGQIVDKATKTLESRMAKGVRGAGRWLRNPGTGISGWAMRNFPTAMRWGAHGLPVYGALKGSGAQLELIDKASEKGMLDEFGESIEFEDGRILPSYEFAEKVEPSEYTVESGVFEEETEPVTGIEGPPGDGDPDMFYKERVVDPDTAEPVELTAKEMVEANKELFGELLGLDKARGQDISDMLIGASAKFLKPGATVKGGLGEFMEAEAARPSRRQKLQDTAAGLAIQDYIAGKRSKEQIAALTGKIDYEYKKKLEMSMPQKDDTAQVALYKIAALTDSKSGSDSTIKEFIKFKTGAPTVRNDKIKMKDLEKKKNKLTIGYNIIEEDGVKNIVKWDGTNYDIVSLSEIWAQE
jgi:hypothetical protein